MVMKHCKWTKSVVIAALLGIGHGQALAAGLFLAPRGVRPLARGGSFVAGADDVNALSYNPAGLSEAADSILLDAALPVHNTVYARSVYGDGNYAAPVNGQGLGFPSPTLGIAHDFGLLEGLRFGLGISADYPMIQNWPDGPDAPQRYAVGNYRGTMLTKLAAGAGFRLNEWVSLGGSLQILAGNFTSQTTVSACDGAMCTQPENSEYDTTIQMRANNILVPGVQLGILVRPLSWMRLGFAWESGYTVDQPATLNVRLPTAAAYRGADMEPASPMGRLHMALPQQLRAGVEFHDAETLRGELGFYYEPWGVHDRIEIDTGNAAIRNLFALGTYGMAPMSIDRGFRDTWSARLGGEWSPKISDEQPLTLRAGVMYEPSAIPINKMTALTVDLNKVLGALGVEYSIYNCHFEATYAHIFMAERTVTQSSMLQTNPTRPPWDGRTPIGNGVYRGQASLFGLGVRVDI